MDDRKRLWIGGVGAVVTALCCFTPILVVLLTAIGIGGLNAYLDAVLLPLLLGFLFLSVFSVVSQRQALG